VKNVDGVELVGTGLYDFTKSLTSVSNSPKEALKPEAGVDYGLFVFFGVPAR